MSTGATKEEERVTKLAKRTNAFRRVLLLVTDGRHPILHPSCSR